MGMSWLLPVGMRLGSVFNVGKNWVLEKHKLGFTPDKDALKAVLLMELIQIKIPKVNSKSVFGPEELEHFAAALAGLVLNYLDAESQEKEHAAL
jgi:hypothetical protein